MKHSDRIYRKILGSYQEHGHMTAHGFGKSEIRECPDCGRQARWLLNYLGGENSNVLCDGERFYRPHQQTLAQLVGAIDRDQLQ